MKRATHYALSVLSITLCLLSLPAASAEVQPSVWVTAVPVNVATLTDTLLVYGTVEPDPERLVGINSAYAGQVSQLWVTPGQLVTRGDALLKIDTDPSAHLSYTQAVVQANYARQELTRLREQRQEHLATNAEVANAEQTVEDADAALATQKKLGTQQSERIVRATFDGMVNAISVAVGDRIQSGIPLLQIAQHDRLLIGLGIEPAEAHRVKAGMAVTIAPVFNPKQIINSTITTVHARVDQLTGLVNAALRLHNSQTTELLPGMRVQGKITLERSKSLAVPRTALLTDDQGAYVFILEGSKARRVNVKPGIEEGNRVGISGDLRATDSVVATGNYELADGVRVRLSRQ